VRDSFQRQGIMHTIGATLETIAPGEVAIRFAPKDALSQQHGFVHAGVVATVLDSACGYAAFSLMPENAGVLTIEFATGRVRKPGRNITFAEGEIHGFTDGQAKLVATMSASMMTILGREGVVD
jgi:acyl-coenzyme A thioesterase PaaI-like protein